MREKTTQSEGNRGLIHHLPNFFSVLVLVSCKVSLTVLWILVLFVPSVFVMAVVSQSLSVMASFRGHKYIYLFCVAGCFVLSAMVTLFMSD